MNQQLTGDQLKKALVSLVENHPNINTANARPYLNALETFDFVEKKVEKEAKSK